MKKSIPAATVLMVALACARAEGPVRFAGATMGTGYRVEIVELPAGVDADTLRAEVDRILRSVDERMSTYDPDSELSRFNASMSTGWFAVTADTRAVVADALRISELSDGAFDVTVGPLVELWGFGPGGSPGAVPPASDVIAARGRVGHVLLETRASPPALRKLAPDLTVDLSSLAKGFAVDAVARHLDRAGVRRYLVEVGGELRARGRNTAGGPWRVAIESPPGARGRVQRVVQIEDRAIATSGDYRKFFETDGRRYSHVVDPRTGRPVTDGVASATVVAATAIEADALATALMVLGPEEGLGLVEQLGLSALLILRTGDGLVEVRSPGFGAEALP